jgi:Holliday junction DNA helicase RuvA
MIARLTGTLVEITNQAITLDVHDVGYQVFVTEQWKSHTTIGTTHTLAIATVVKDDAIELFGFSTSSKTARQ